MKRYLHKTFDWKTDEIVQVYDELPLWSAPFGKLLLDNFPIARYDKVLDVAFGAGFPLTDIAQRLGNSCKVYGIDNWSAAVKRTKTKIKTLDINNITILESDASKIEIADNFFDLITCNLGINNFENPEKVLSELNRVLKVNSGFCATTNPTGTFKEFYSIFEKTIMEPGFKKYLPKLKAHIDHRGTEESLSKLIADSGFKITKIIKDNFKMRFIDGTSFLNHSFTLIGFFAAWKEIIEESDREKFFAKFENNLNEYTENQGELKLTVPMLYFECVKTSAPERDNTKN